MDRRALKSTLETCSNVAVLLVAVAGLSVLAIIIFVKPAMPTLHEGLRKGKIISWPAELNYQANPQTLLLALKTDCHYCSESLPLYRTLSNAQAVRTKSLRMVALFPNDATSVAKYIKENELPFEAISGVDFSELGVSGTPTMILINNDGEVEDFWIGKLTTAIADEFLNAISTHDRSKQ